MSLSFSAIPISIRTPGVFLEFDSSRAVRGLPVYPQRVLLIGQRLATGSVAALTPIRVNTVAQAIAYFGRGSMLARMFKAFKAVNDTLETWACALDDLVGGVKGVQTITYSGAVTAAGTLVTYLGGQRITVAVAAAQATASIATAVAAAITAAPDLPFTATAAGSVVTATAQHKGAASADLDIRHNYYQGEALPAGLAVAVATTVAGTGNPDISTVWTALGDAFFPTMVIPYADATNLALVDTELARRAGPLVQIESMAYCAAKGTQAALSTLGAARNSPYLSIIGAKSSPTPPTEWAAAYAAAVAFAGQNDPARPFQTLPLPGILAPADVDRFIRSERDLLLVDGISTYTVDGSGLVLLERPITNYQTNAGGLDDVAYLDVNTPLTLFYLRYSMRARIAAKYPRHKLADDGNVYPAGQAIVTPKDIRAELVALFLEWMDAGLVENIEQFKRDLIVERDPTDVNRVNALIPPDVVNQFRVFAGQIQFLL
jgi:phage tail sheath gpL-like